jgi:hypothetical protein
MTVLRPSLRRCLPGLVSLAVSLGAPWGCGPADPCADVDGTCLSLRLLGEGDAAVDNVLVDLSGQGVAHRFSRDVPSLPALLPMALGPSVSGTLAIAAFGTRAGAPSARGELQVPVTPGLKQTLDLVLAPYACMPGEPLPCTPVDPTTSLQPTGISPTSGPTSGGTVVTLVGSGFKQGAKVLFGNVAAPVVEWRSGNELVASSPARLGMLGLADVVITNPDGQKGTLNAAFRYFASQFFTDVKPEVKLPANTSAAFSIAVADLDGDGKTDAVVTNRDSSTLTLLFGKGDGTFENPTNLVGNELGRPGGVALVDVNGDQKLDIVVAAETTGAVLLYLGNGTRNGFQTSTAGVMALRIPFGGVGGVTAGNFDGDGKVDLFLFSNAQNLLAVAPNKGPSGGMPAFDDPNAANNKDPFEKPVAIAVSDMDGDQRDDVVGIGQPGAGKDNLVVTLSKAGGAKKTYRAACVLAGVAVADFDGDGKKDVAATCNDTGQIALWKGKGGADLDANVTLLRLGLSPHAIAAADFDLDGRPDLAVTIKRYGVTVEAQDPDSEQVYFLMNDGKGGFRPAQGTVVARGPSAIAVADLDRDALKRPDVVVSAAYGMSGTGLVNVLLNTAQ